jgi:uncharacterized OB-fold protein
MTDLKIRNVLKFGTGYDLITVEERSRLVLGIHCHSCGRVSFHPKDIDERYCGHCKVFHEEGLLAHEA